MKKLKCLLTAETIWSDGFACRDCGAVTRRIELVCPEHGPLVTSVMCRNQNDGRHGPLLTVFDGGKP